MEVDSEVELVPHKGKEREKCPREQNTHKEVPYPRNAQTFCTRIATKLGNVITNPQRSAELLENYQNVPQGGGNSETLQWMESTIIQTSKKKDKGLEHQKEGGKQGRRASSFYQKATSKPASTIGEEEKEKELEETIFSKSQEPKNSKGCYE
ncbi:hypothetical protein O181_020252 [Austropuccinia psidii MF-1]|uniref:Uncharacterized protein n=1 Tax=Austropuccinia psidii MF-1 TaxID=1389203 RepID=A0A9Q3GV58_9BASI|nr:hypothetical protein [Austropuccinia psidii MF-1]